MNAPEVLVVVHTSDAQGVVGVARGDDVFSESLDARGQHARSLLGTLERVLQRAALTMRDVNGIVVTSGPGSFTGIRIGLATAQGLAAARGCGVWTCDSLHAEAEACLRADAGAGGARPAGSCIAVVQDARRGEVYAGLYDDGGAKARTVVAPFCDAPARASARLRAAWTTPPYVALGTGAALLEPEPHGFEVVPRPGNGDVVEALVHMARAGACRRVEAHALEPTYLRKSDAEIKRERSS